MKLNIFFILCSLFFSVNLYAFKFSPMSSTIGIKGSDSNTVFYLENDSNRPIAVQVSLVQREMDINGIEKNPKIGNELSVYPTQLIIPAGEKRSVRVGWTGTEAPVKELSYRLIAEQLPIDLEKSKNKKTSIKVLLRYIAALYVKSEDFTSDISIKEIKIADKKVSIEVNNAGKRHQVLSNLNLKFVNDKTKKEILFKADELRGMSGENILASSSRVFTFTQSGKFAEINSTDKVKFSFDKD